MSDTIHRLYIDDVRELPFYYRDKRHPWTIIRTYAQAIAWLETYGCPDVISFDHDLGDPENGSGYDIAKYIVERDMNEGGKFIPEYFTYTVHSANIIGAANIVGLLDQYLREKQIVRDAKQRILDRQSKT